MATTAPHSTLTTLALQLAYDANKSQEEIKLRLEKREADWVKRHGKIEAPRIASTSRAAQANGSRSAATGAEVGSRSAGFNGGLSPRS